MPTTTTKSIAQQDKDLMDLHSQIEQKEAQLKEDYRRLQKDVKHNPLLQAALDEYKAYFAQKKTEKNKQIKALNALLKANAVGANGVGANGVGANANAYDDQKEIKREIMLINRK
jgi:hypothetical protein